MTDLRLEETLIVKFSVFLVFGFVCMVWCGWMIYDLLSPHCLYLSASDNCFVIIYKIIEGDIVREVIEASSKFAYSTNKILST